MINILVVDDNPLKLQKINRLLTSVEEIEEECIKIAPDIINAKRSLLENKFDLMILDIQIPNRLDQAAKNDGGLIFLEELQRSQRYKMPSHIIGLTAHNESYQEAEEIFSEQLLSIVKYEDSSSDWSTKIYSYLERIVNTKKSDNFTIRKSYDYDLAIICALDNVELESIKNLSANWSEHIVPNDSTVYYTCNFNNGSKNIKVVAAACPQMGMPAASVLAMKLIHNFTPNYLVMTGIAAGVRGNNNLGDILVADPSWDYGSGKIEDCDGEPTFFPDPQPIRLDADLKSILTKISSNHVLLNEIRNAWPADKPATSLNLHIGPVASGSAVLAHSSIVDTIKRHNRKLIGIEMETYGVLYAAINCVKPRPIAFSLKSVCDFADSEKADNFQRYAAFTSAKLLYHLATEYLEFENHSKLGIG